MREIKFRAWDNKKKEWLLGYEYKNLGGFSLFGELVLLGEWSSVLDSYIFNRNGHKFEDLKVMQFTGLLDKNGKEIYEGDIITYLDDARKKQKGVIEYCYGTYKAEAIGGDEEGNQDAHISDIEGECAVIGNIYENPELLK